MTDSEGEELDAVLRAVRERVTPDAREQQRLETAVEALRDRASAVVSSLPSPASEADIVHVGSTARDTWLAGDQDIDLFIRFPMALAREELERYGLQVGHEMLPDGREEYAEHPYVTGTYEGFDVDLVPCYAVPDATAIRSSVDRTPFHNAYLEDKLGPDLTGDVRVFKQFLSAIGAYGSDLRTRGFSGYLAELLIVEFDGLRSLLKDAADWRPPVQLDPEDHGDPGTFEDPLIVVDPTDPTRNVAAVLSPENLARFQHHARKLLADPRASGFEVSPPGTLTPDELEEHIQARGTDPLAIRFEIPPIVDDQLYPQLRRSLAGVGRELEERGFEVVRSATFATEREAASTGPEQSSDSERCAALFFELETATLPRIERHEGPPVEARDHATGFYEKYADDPATYGPFLDGDRYVVERQRDRADADSVLESSALFDAAHGAQIADALREGYTVHRGDDIPALAQTFGEDLRRYYHPSV